MENQQQLLTVVEPDHVIGFLNALSLQLDGIERRVKAITSILKSFDFKYRIPCFVVVINHPARVTVPGLWPTVTVVSCNYHEYFSTNFPALQYASIYHVLDEISEVSRLEACSIASDTAKLMRSAKGAPWITPYAL